MAALENQQGLLRVDSAGKPKTDDGLLPGVNQSFSKVELPAEVGDVRSPDTAAQPYSIVPGRASEWGQC